MGYGLVKSLSHPGENLTGVKVPETTPKALEWMKIIIPGMKKVYLPYNPYDTISLDYLPMIHNTASELGIELILHRIYSVEETIASIEHLSKDIDAIFMIPSITLNPRSVELSQAAIRRGLPFGGGLPPSDKTALMTFSSDFYGIGKQLARLADEIHMGTKPTDIPIETAECYLTINLKTAKKIGLNIPDNILVQAKTVTY